MISSLALVCEVSKRQAIEAKITRLVKTSSRGRILSFCSPHGNDKVILNGRNDACDVHGFERTTAQPQTKCFCIWGIFQPPLESPAG
jgi:hypothetical protein